MRLQVELTKITTDWSDSAKDEPVKRTHAWFLPTCELYLKRYAGGLLSSEWALTQSSPQHSLASRDRMVGRPAHDRSISLSHLLCSFNSSLWPLYSENNHTMAESAGSAAKSEPPKASLHRAVTDQGNKSERLLRVNQM
jgi:hypothetical protein